MAVSPLNAIMKNGPGSGTDVKFAVTLKLSIASPSSAPEASTAVQRIQVVAPTPILNPVKGTLKQRPENKA